MASDACSYLFAFNRWGRVLRGFPLRQRATRRRSPEPRQTHGPRVSRRPDTREPERQAGTGDRRRGARPPPLRLDPRGTAAAWLPGAARGPDQGPIDRPGHARGDLQARRRPASGPEVIDTASIGDVDGDGRRHRRGHERGVPRAPERHRRDLQRARRHRWRLQRTAVSSARPAPPGLPFLPGFPAKMGRLGCEILPVGRRDRRPAGLHLNGDGRPEIGVSGDRPGLPPAWRRLFLPRERRRRQAARARRESRRGLRLARYASILSLSGGVFRSLTRGKPKLHCSRGRNRRAARHPTV